MATRAPYLQTRFGAYLHREVPDEDAELSHVGPDTPCGEYLRRFWQPICFSDELKDLPHRVKILGEELVVFRDLSGTVGLLERHCPHRGASLEFGLIDARGIRCCYHGWQFAADGTILETPGEPAHSTLKDRLYQGAYPTHEYSGIVFAYMGPPDRRPPFPVYASFVQSGNRLMPGRKYFYPCNWLQIVENAMDPAHTAFLHTIISGSQFTDEFGVLPELEYVETPVGMIYIGTRRVGSNVWARMVEVILPNLQQVAPIWEDGRRELEVVGLDRVRLWLAPCCGPDGRYDALYLSNYAQINLFDSLSRVKGVGLVTFLGQRQYSMRAWLDPLKMASFVALPAVTATSMESAPGCRLAVTENAPDGPAVAVLISTSAPSGAFI